jgi:3-polyprenyl-4-hydroxybenzoate decarboxylase
MSQDKKPIAFYNNKLTATLEENVPDLEDINGPRNGVADAHVLWSISHQTSGRSRWNNKDGKLI